MEDIKQRTFAFAVQITSLFRDIHGTETGKAIGYQLVRAGTSIGANVEEADAGYTKKEFIYKMNIALGETRETHYWLRLMQATDTRVASRIEPLLSEAAELRKILATIVRKSRSLPA